MIQPCQRIDIPAILSLIRELAKYEKLSARLRSNQKRVLPKHLFGPTRAPPAPPSLNATPPSSASPSGFAPSPPSSPSPASYLEDLYVQPAHRDKGLGKAFLKCLANIAVERNYGRIEWSVLKWNAPSIAFYKSLGAEPLAEWDFMRLTGDALKSFARK